MQGTVKGHCITVIHGSHWSVPVPKIIGAAKYDHNVGIRIHLVNTLAEIQIPPGIFRGNALLGDSSPSDSVVSANGTGFGRETADKTFLRLYAVALRNAVTEKVDFCMMQFHRISPVPAQETRFPGADLMKSYHEYGTFVKYRMCYGNILSAVWKLGEIQIRTRTVSVEGHGPSAFLRC